MLNSLLAVTAPPPFDFSPEGLTHTAAFYGESALQNIITFAPKLVAAGLVLWIGSNIASRTYGWALKKTTASGKIDTTLGNFAASWCVTP